MIASTGNENKSEIFDCPPPGLAGTLQIERAAFIKRHNEDSNYAKSWHLVCRINDVRFLACPRVDDLTTFRAFARYLLARGVVVDHPASAGGAKGRKLWTEALQAAQAASTNEGA